MMQTADSASWFFSNSRLALENGYENYFLTKMKQMCKTCWVECLEAFEVFRAFLCCIEEIASSHASEWNRESRSDAILSCLPSLSLLLLLV